MLFNSYEFIFIFLPIAFIGYFGLNYIGKYRIATVLLTLMSLFFYGYHKIDYLWIILCSIILNYGLHRLLLGQAQRNKRFCKAILVLGIVANVGILYFFKYFNFTVDIVNALTRQSINIMQIALPLGISFFTFQQVGFLVDSYKGEINKQRFWPYALFVTFFPQLIAGPIVNHDEMLPQFESKENKCIQWDNIMLGIRAFVYGLSKKVLIADTLGKAVDWGYQYYEVLDGLNIALVIILYSLQLYFDFSGYCDMARGLGYFFNIQIPLNFNSPYKSKNMVDFWRRWHITLGRFFTRYVYIPLGGNRKGFIRGLLNVFIVFCISGIWHGAGWTFVVWGLVHAFAQVCTRIWWKLKEKCNLPQIKNKLIKWFSDLGCMVISFLFVAFAFGIFRADNLTQAWGMIRRLPAISELHPPLEIASFLCFKETDLVLKVLGQENHPLIQMCLFLGIVATITWGGKNVYETEKAYKAGYLSVAIYGVLFVWCVLSLSNVSTFLYFNF
ncbi:MAG: MBOAT family protein [Lachnospiraceae bacterium]|nr:MBOAT family protein [Lachnospiraceae bacterium]